MTQGIHKYCFTRRNNEKESNELDRPDRRRELPLSTKLRIAVKKQAYRTETASGVH